jgi:protocatechuate 3,4-dioxygenase beta subunit
MFCRAEARRKLKLAPHLLAAVALSANAGSIQGVVLEQATGRPLSRTVVRLEPVAKPGEATGTPLISRSGRSGYFVFPAVAPGLYLVIAERDGFFTGMYGQRLSAGRGTPVPVASDSNIFADIRMRHKGAITGRVLDENGVGRPGTNVVAYRAQLPLRAAGSATSDDRGVYRIHGLAPGKYWVRSAAQSLDDGSGWLPTYGPMGRETRDARVHRVTVDADTTDADVNPDPGSLFRLGGIIACDRDGPVTVVLSSETGRRETQTGCKGSYQFDGLAPASYEVFARMQDGSASGFIELYLGGDNVAANVQVMQLPAIEFEICRAGTNSALDIPLVVFARRQDLAVTDAVKEIRTARAALDPGHWEFRAQVPDGQYVESITNYWGGSRRAFRAETRPRDWFDVFIESRAPARIRISVSDRAGEISEIVRAEGQAAPGAPVFLWPVEEAARRSLGGSKQMLTDTEGRFRLGSLPPGDYRVVASYDITEIDEELLELSRARVIRVEASQKTAVELDLWMAP